MIVMLFMLSACSKKKQIMTDAITNRDSVPIMTTREVSTYISDSGVVKYKIIADEWKVFDRLDPSRWTFEEGVYLEKYDNKLNIEAIITADTAYYYDKQELWELRGNVHIENEQDEQFDTQLLFWNQKSKEVYSDLYIRIRQQKRIITGIGFTSNQDFTKYTIKKTQGIFPIKEGQRMPADSTTVAIEEAPESTGREHAAASIGQKSAKKEERPAATEEKAEAEKEKTDDKESSETDDAPSTLVHRKFKSGGKRLEVNHQQLKLRVDSVKSLNHQPQQ